MPDSLVVNEIYLSLQGESTRAGLPCVFIRLTACNLRCSYCDTAYAFKEGRAMSLEAIQAEVRRLAEPYGKDGAAHGWPMVELTGGEPLLQKNAPLLMTRLCDDGFTVLLETSGAHDIAVVDPRVHRIMDLKCPSSGEVDRNRWANLRHLRPRDELKFVIGTVEDYTWARETILHYQLQTLCPLLVSWVQPLTSNQQDASLKPVPAGMTPITRVELVERIVADGLPVRFQIQMHKVLWPAQQRGV